MVTFYLEGDYARWLGCALFAAAGLTRLARRPFRATLGGQQSELSGGFLDPIADKPLVAATLFMLTVTGRLSNHAVLPALVILCREILVSGLREYLAGLRVGLPVSRLAKWKTVIQMVAIGVLIVGSAGWHVLAAGGRGFAGETLLWLAAMLTIVTGYDYLRAGLMHIAGPRPPGDKTRRLA